MSTDSPANVTDDHNNVTLTYDPEVIQVNTSDWDTSSLVTVTAVDGTGQQASCQFQVTVKGQSEVKVIALLHYIIDK